MKKTIFYAALGLSLIATSCKETVEPTTASGGSTPAEDSTYVDQNIDPPEARRMLIEELTGVTCVNCPDGAQVLKKMLSDNPNSLSVLSYHTGSFSDPIAGLSNQNFQTVDGTALRTKLWGSPNAYPTAIFDRIKINPSVTNPLFVDGYGEWPAFLATDKAKYTTTPVNLKVTSTYIDAKKQYNIEVTVKYTQDVTGDNALNVFLSQDNITDVQEYSPSKYDSFYVFNHVFRKALTDPIYGKIIAKDLPKTAGRVYIYRTSVAIDPTDAKQKYWKAEDMHVTAFVSVANDINDIHIMQVKQTSLKN
jgi:hypothetical protein